MIIARREKASYWSPERTNMQLLYFAWANIIYNSDNSDGIIWYRVNWWA